MTRAGGARTGEHRSYHHGNLREALIAAGLELARGGGPDAVVLRAASRMTGVTHTAGYAHFANKQDLLAAVAQRCMTELAQLMIERRNRVSTLDEPRFATARLEAIGRAYIDFARTEPGWFRTAFSAARPHRAPGSTAVACGADAQRVPAPDEVLRGALDELVHAGVIVAQRRDGAELATWSAVHGLCRLMLDGPLSDLPDTAVEQAIGTVLANVYRGLMPSPSGIGNAAPPEPTGRRHGATRRRSLCG